MKDDTVSRAAAIDVMCELMRHWFGGDPKDEVREIKRELEKLPAVQPQPGIIRCKDCKHWGKRGLCEMWDHYISNEDFYCGCAGRRTDEQNS